MILKKKKKNTDNTDVGNRTRIIRMVADKAVGKIMARLLGGKRSVFDCSIVRLLKSRKMLSVAMALGLFSTFCWGRVYAQELEGWAGEGQRTQMEQMSTDGTDGKKATEKGLSVSRIFTAFLGNVRERFSSRAVIYSPLPVRLSGGVKPAPSAIFELESEDTEQEKVLGAREGEQPTRYFYFENKAGLKVYSLEEEWATENTVNTVDSKDSSGVTKTKKPENAGEVWGARIAAAEEEIVSWTRDTGVILSVIVLAGLAGLGALVFVIRKLVTRSVTNTN